MKSLSNTFLNLLILRKGPQDLPDSAKLLQILLLFDIALSLGYVQQMVSWKDAIIHVSIAISLLAGLTYGLLAFNQLSYRFVQTFTALIGVDLLFTLLRWLLEILGILSSAFEENIGIFPALLEVILGAWILVIQGNIFQHALNISRLKGCLVALAFMVIFLLVFSRLDLPETVQEPNLEGTSLEQELEMEELNATPLNHTTGHFERQLVLRMEDFSLLQQGVEPNMKLVSPSTHFREVI